MADDGLDATRAILLDQRTSAEERAARLWPLVYDQLRAAAQRALQSERPDHTLQATALVHEVYLRLVGPRDVPWQGRAHFYSAAAEAMRRILVDHARARLAAKRAPVDGRRAALELTGLPDSSYDEESAGFLILDEAIQRLRGVDGQAAEVVRMRYFAGLDVDTTAASLGVSAPTVKRAWAFARAWLRHELRDAD